MILPNEMLKPTINRVLIKLPFQWLRSKAVWQYVMRDTNVI